MEAGHGADDRMGPSPKAALQSIQGALHELKWPPVLERTWSSAPSSPTTAVSVRVMSFNILADSKQKEEEWSATPEDVLDWSKRRLRLLEILLREEPDVICLQELDLKESTSCLDPELSSAGYQGVFAKLTPPATDSCGIFFRQSRFTVLEEADAGYAVAVLLKEVKSQELFVVASAHLKAGKTEAAEKQRREQLISLLEILSRMSRSAQGIILACDLNAVSTEDEKIGKPLAYTAALSHELMLRSSYAESSKEPDFTTWKLRPKGEVKRTIDYIFHSPSLCPAALLKLPEPSEMPQERLPSHSYPSDHLALGVEFVLSSDRADAKRFTGSQDTVSCDYAFGLCGSCMCF